MAPNTTLLGFAELPADTLSSGPASGAALTNPTNGRATPFQGQPVQGFSGVQFSRSGNGQQYLFLSDNGYGALSNSADYLLRLHQVDPSFRGFEAGGDGSVKLNGLIQLSDPDRKVPFPIVREQTAERWLTGADFDVESIVVAPNGDLWIGEEFGPYLLHFNAEGKLLEAPIPTPNLSLGNTVSTLTGKPPIVIGHRGASGELPEHTLESYRLAILRGADFIEPDLVATKDGQLIARHEPNLLNTTDVSTRPEFASKRTTKVVDGVAEEGFFASDFTLAEIKSLRAVMPQGFRTQAFNSAFEIPTLKEIIELVKDMEAKTGKAIGIYPETKHPTYHDNLGLSLEEKLLEVLKQENFVDPKRVFIQSFEVSNLKELQSKLMPLAGIDLPLVQLLDAYDVADDGSLIYADVNARPYDFAVSGDKRTYADLQTPEGLAEIATYADGIGPWKPMILSSKIVDANKDGAADDLNGDGTVNGQDRILGTPTSLVSDAHATGLFVHAYTFRNEPRYLAFDYGNNPQTEYATFFNLGVDGLFSDFPGTADQVRDDRREVRSPQNPAVRTEPVFNTLRGNAPLVIGHRGDSGSRPEHTLAAYRSAIAKGADFIEPDLVLTKDNVLIARHEPMLAVVQLDANGAILRDASGQPILNTSDTSTDVFKRPEFTDRLVVKNLDGVLKGGWFAEDFTLAEIKQLNAIERIPEIRGTKFNNDGLKIPTLAEVIDLVKQVEADTGRKIGIYPETKHPSYFLTEGKYADGVTVIGKDTSQLLIDTLKKENFTDPSRIFIQSFEVSNLKRLNTVIMPAAGLDIPLIQLLGGSGKPYDFVLNNDARTYTSMTTAAGLADIKSYAEGIGPNKGRILPQSFQDTNNDGKSDDLNKDGKISDADTIVGATTSLVADAHAAGLLVHLYTLRDDPYFLPNSYGGDATKEYQAFINLGVDGFFTDFPGSGNAVLASRYLAGYGIGSGSQRYGDQISPNLGGSGGFEGMASSPDGKTLYPLLEKSVSSDIPGTLRIYRYDVDSRRYSGLAGFYRMEKASNAIGDLTPINDREFIVIERDSSEGSPTGFKRLYKIDISKLDSKGFVEKQEIADLMAIQDPNDLNKDGSKSYTMPFTTIENVLVLDANKVLVANDNNYPFSKGRPPAIDNNEMVILQLEKPLNLDPRLGLAAASATPQAVIEPLMVPVSPGYGAKAIYTIGEIVSGFAASGIPDGQGAYRINQDTIRILVNSEISNDKGYSYLLANGTRVQGARINFIDINNAGQVIGGDIAYDTIFDRTGKVVINEAQLRGPGITTGGLNRFCSANLVEANTFGAGKGAADRMFLLGEEFTNGSMWILNVDKGELWAAPDLGYGGWESATLVDTGSSDRIAYFMGDDGPADEGAPLYLYVGTKNPSGNFLERNGLVGGQLYYWKASNPSIRNEDGLSEGSTAAGTWVAINTRDASRAGQSGYDAQGYKLAPTLRTEVFNGGGFMGYRVEDVDFNPVKPNQIAFNTTGGGKNDRAGDDKFGSIWTLAVNFDANGFPKNGDLKHLYDGDAPGKQQAGVRSPDNLDWSGDGNIYVNEDRSTPFEGKEASIWKVNANSGAAERILVMNRDAALPAGQKDNEAGSLGAWESSGIIDVSNLYGNAPGTDFFFNVQAHGVTGGTIDNLNLVEGGQILRVSKLSQSSIEKIDDLQSANAPFLLDPAATSYTSVASRALASRSADYDSKVGFYRVLNANGDVPDPVTGTVIKPGEAGYAKAALGSANRVTDTLLARTDQQIASEAVVFENYSSNGLVALFGNVLTTNQTYFSFAAANADGYNHFKFLGSNKVGFEDLFGGGDKDHNDLIVDLNFG